MTNIEETLCSSLLLTGVFLILMPIIVYGIKIDVNRWFSKRFRVSESMQDDIDKTIKANLFVILSVCLSALGGAAVSFALIRLLK